MTLRTPFLNEMASLGLPEGPGADGPVVEADLVALPAPAQRYLRCMGVVGRARDWSFRLGWRGRFRRGATQPWMPCEAWQYNSRPAIARIMHLRVRLAGLIPLVGRDTYIGGHGRMLIKLLDLVSVVDATGTEFDLGELVTYLNDAVLLAPSMLLVPAVSWSAVDAHSFTLALTDQGHTVTARVTIDERGLPHGFSTTDRFLEDPANPRQLIRAEWTTPVTEWGTIEGRPFPIQARAVWRLPGGDLPYADFQLIPGSAAFNIPPGR
jgi:hypothetical protein